MAHALAYRSAHFGNHRDYLLDAPIWYHARVEQARRIELRGAAVTLVVAALSLLLSRWLAGAILMAGGIGTFLWSLRARHRKAESHTPATPPVAVRAEGKGKIRMRGTRMRGFDRVLEAGGEGQIDSTDLDATSSATPSSMPVSDPMASVTNEQLAAEARQTARDVLALVRERSDSFPMEFLSDKNETEREEYFQRQANHQEESETQYTAKYQSQVRTLRDSLKYRGFTAPQLEAWGSSGYHSVAVRLMAEELIELANRLSPESQ